MPCPSAPDISTSCGVLLAVVPVGSAMDDDSGDNDLRENRFAYLLQPIRDLAANWDVNIAAELEEYLEELENLTFAIEGHGPSLNFAEAALLIQVSKVTYAVMICWCFTLVHHQ